MSTTTTEAPKTKVITGVVRLSYAHIFTPSKAKDSDKEKYSVAILIPKSDTATIKALEAGIEVAKAEGLASKFGGKKAGLKLPLRDGDTEKDDDANYTGHYWINCSSSNKPGVLNQKKLPASQDEVYSGCFARVSLNFYPFNKDGNKGVAAGLQNILKVRDGDPLSGGVSAEDDFADIRVDEEDDFM